MKYDGEVWRDMLKERYGGFPVDKNSVASVVKELIGETPPDDFVSDIVADLIKQGVLVEISPGVYSVTPAPKPVEQKVVPLIVKAEVYDELKELQELVDGNQLCDPNIVRNQFEAHGLKLSEKELRKVLEEFGCEIVKKKLKKHPPVIVVNAVGGCVYDTYALYLKLNVPFYSMQFYAENSQSNTVPSRFKNPVGEYQL